LDINGVIARGALAVASIAIGAVVGFHDCLPRRTAAIGTIGVGLMALILGGALLIWVGYNFYIEHRVVLSGRAILIPIFIISVGTGFMGRGISIWKSLKNESRVQDEDKSEVDHRN